MKACIEGNVPAPHTNIAIEVTHWFGDEYHITYTARPAELAAAGIVTPYMADKILNQRAGRMSDENRRRFDLRTSSGLSQNKRALWESGEPVRIRYRVYSPEALDLAGVSELCRNGLPTNSEKNGAGADLASQYWLVGCAAMLQRDVGGDIVRRDRAVGRFQRLVTWVSIGGVVLMPDFVKIRAHVIAAKGL